MFVILWSKPGPYGLKVKLIWSQFPGSNIKHLIDRYISAKYDPLGVCGEGRRINRRFALNHSPLIDMWLCEYLFDIWWRRVDFSICSTSISWQPHRNTKPLWLVVQNVHKVLDRKNAKWCSPLKTFPCKGGPKDGNIQIRVTLLEDISLCMLSETNGEYFDLKQFPIKQFWAHIPGVLFAIAVWSVRKLWNTNICLCKKNRES